MRTENLALPVQINQPHLSMKNLKLLLAAGLAGLAFLAPAQNVPNLINYQGFLVDASGAALTNSSCDLTFRVWSARTGGSLLWGPQQLSGVALVGGRFNVILGPTDAASRYLTNAFTAANAYLELQVGTNAPVDPRQQVLSAPYALKAANSDLFGGYNWQAVFTDTGRPTDGTMPGSKIAPASLNTAQIANNAITASQIAGNAVTPAHIANGSLPGSKISPGTVSSLELSNNAVVSAKIADLNVTTPKIADLNVTAAKLADLNVTTAKIADQSVTSTKIANLSVGTAQISDGAVTTSKIANGAVGSAQIAAGSIQQSNVGTIYRLSASDGSPTNALEVAADGAVLINGTRTASQALSVFDNNADGDALYVYGNAQFSSGGGGSMSYGSTNETLRLYSSMLSGTPLTVGLRFSRSVKQPLAQTWEAYLSFRSVNLNLNYAGLAVQGGLYVTNFSGYGATPVYWDPDTKQVMAAQSSKRYKENIRPWHENAYDVLKLEPKVFTRPGRTNQWEVGYLAEETDHAGLKAVTVYDAKGRPEAIDYARIVLYSNEILKDQQKKLEKQQTEIETLKQTVNELKAALERLVPSAR
jgi:hypothetical protein